MRYRSADTLRPEHVGRRVTVRYRLPDGPQTDAVGTLEGIEEHSVLVRVRTGELVRIERARITAYRVIRAKTVPPG